jgi:hypothetical protein
MRNLIMAFLLSTTILIANAGKVTPTPIEVPFTVKCAETQSLLDYLVMEFGEKMVWIGKTINVESFIALYKNVDSGTWTMVQYDGRMACVIGAGETGTPI